MSEEKKYTLAEADLHFGIQFNNQIWGLLEKEKRTEAEDSAMINAAHASLLHWNRSEKCTPANQQRGEFMISTAYAHVGRAEPALHHAQRCLHLTERYPVDMQDFDRAYAYSAMARALAVGSQQEMAKKYLDLALQAGEAIAGKEDRKIFMGDFNTGPWYGVK